MRQCRTRKEDGFCGKQAAQPGPIQLSRKGRQGGGRLPPFPRRAYNSPATQGRAHEPDGSRAQATLQPDAAGDAKTDDAADASHDAETDAQPTHKPTGHMAETDDAGDTARDAETDAKPTRGAGPGPTQGPQCENRKRETRPGSNAGARVFRNLIEKTMRKKIALLLAAAMVFTGMPLHAFGSAAAATANVPSSVSPRLPSGTGVDAADVQEFTAVVPMDAFSVLPIGNNERYYLQFQLHGATAFNAAASGRTHFALGLAENAPHGRNGFTAEAIPANVVNSNAMGQALMDAFTSLDTAGLIPADVFNGPTAGMVRIPLSTTSAAVGSALENTTLFEEAGFNAPGAMFTPSLEGAMTFAFDAIVNARAAALSIRIMRHNLDGSLEEVRTILHQDNGRLMFDAVTTGITVPDAGSFPTLVQHARIDEIVIREASVGQLAPIGNDTNWIAVRLVAPREYNWDLRALDFGDPFRVIMNNAPQAGNPTVAAGGVLGGRAPFIHFNESTQRAELNFFVPASRGSTVAQQTTLSQIQIQNARIIALPGAPATGNVEIEIYVRNLNHISNAAGGGTSAGWPSAAPANPGAFPPFNAGPPTTDAHVEQFARFAGTALGFLGWDGDPSGTPVFDNWHVTDHHVANRGVGGVSVVVPAEADRAVGTSGMRTADWLTSGVANDWINRDAYTLRLQETSTNQIFSGMNTWEIRAEQPGVRIEAVQIRTQSNAIEGEVPATPPAGVSDFRAWHWHYTPATYEYLVPALTRLDRDFFQFTPRVNPGTTTGREASHLHVVDMRFQFIIEPGFEALNPGGAIELTVVGPGVNETVVVAYATDPIVVTGSEPLSFERNAFDNLPPTRINRVSIEELDAGMLEVGNRLVLDVVAVQGDHIVNLGLLGETIINVLEEPIIDGDMLLRRVPGAIGTRPEWEVIRPSIAGPSTIHFDNITISGGLLPTIDYHVRITGREITRTLVGTQGVNTPAAAPQLGLLQGYIEARNANPDANGRQPAPNMDIRFDGLSYSHPVIIVRGTPEFDGNGLPSVTPAPMPTPDPLPTPEPTPTPAPGRAPIPRRTLDSNVQSLTTHAGTQIQQPVIMRNMAGSQRTFVAIRFLEDVMNIPAEAIVWSGTNQTVTINAQAPDGSPMEVVFTVSGPNASSVLVNGVRQDLASHLTGDNAPGSITPIQHQERWYLPVGAIFSVFGIDFEWRSGFVIVSPTDADKDRDVPFVP